MDSGKVALAIFQAAATGAGQTGKQEENVILQLTTTTEPTEKA